MVSQTSIATPSAFSPPNQNASQFYHQHTPASDTRPRLSDGHSALVLTTNASRALPPVQTASSVSESEQPILARGYSTHLPYNPNRPPPHTYARQHEFPPFPPLAQHPVLPFLTTAFTNTEETQSPQLTKARSTLAPRANTTGRHHNSMISTIPTMDVSKNDPTATFIRPPLVVPLSHHNDPSIDPSSLNGASINGEPAPGTPLTYAILHTHRSWFLDAEDFRKDNPNRIDYPPELEPPRGWAPLPECTGAGATNRCKLAKENKEKNNAVRTKGSYAHADNALTDTSIEYGPSDDCHEKTVLRCTFCRREYHGPNAKSMWRRHVFDKHKVAMKNRREGSAGMAPKQAQTGDRFRLQNPGQKKAKTKAANCANSGPPVDLSTPALTLDLTNEENILRLLERVVRGNININLPASLQNSSDFGDVVNLESIALALQKGGISLVAEGHSASNPLSAASTSHSDTDPDSGPVVQKTTTKAQTREKERRDEGIVRPATGTSLVDGAKISPHKSSIVCDDDDALWDGQYDLHIIQASPPPLPESNKEATFPGQKRKAEDTAEHVTMLHVSANLERVPLKDNTVLDRNTHNLNVRVVPGTPSRDKGKQKALPTTPGAPDLSQGSFLSPSPSSKHPYTPVKLPTALRSRALATTGEESYLTFIASSPATTSPVRGGGRAIFTSPSHTGTSPMKRGDREGPPGSDDALGVLSVSSPRYPFEFNLQEMNSLPYISAFEPIPLELGNMGPAHWTPPSLGPPAHVSESTSRSISRASSIEDEVDVDKTDTRNDNEDRDLEYPDSSSSSDRSQDLSRSLEDFNMEAYLDLEDAGPESETNMPSSPYKNTAARGLQFSKEFGLLSPSEVERITASALPRFLEEARGSKRRKVGVS